MRKIKPARAGFLIGGNIYGHRNTRTSGLEAGSGVRTGGGAAGSVCENMEVCIMNGDAVKIAEKFLEKMKADPALKEYVRIFDISKENVSRKIFPYVSVIDVVEDDRALCIGNDAPKMRDYRIVIHAETRHILPSVARNGDGKGRKGIMQLADDIVATVYPGNICGFFEPTVHLQKVSFEEEHGSDGRIRKAVIVFTGSRVI